MGAHGHFLHRRFERSSVITACPDMIWENVLYRTWDVRWYAMRYPLRSVYTILQLQVKDLEHVCYREQAIGWMRRAYAMDDTCLTTPCVDYLKGEQG